MRDCEIGGASLRMAFSSNVPMLWRQRIADWRGRGVYAGYPNRHHCIFIHIPKTAGTSVVSALFGGASRHVPYFEYEHANPRKFQRFFKFAFVRNPWDRLVSTYSFLRRGGMNEQDRMWSERNLSVYQDFASFVRGWVSEENVWSWVHFVPQTHFILNHQGAVMVDYVGRFERLGEDFAYVATRLGRDIRLGKTNESAHRHFSSYYDEETREIVRRVYARDIAELNYRFDDDQSLKNPSDSGDVQCCSQPA
jgi:chondroitin 4-sulfotransferase 11